MDEAISVEKIGKAGIIRFNRPAIKNPLSVKTLEKLDRIYTVLNFDVRFEKIIFTGSGDTFASGANLNEISRLTQDTAREFGRRGQRLMQKIYNSDKLTMAAINGYCFGGALDLAMSCKRRIASPNTIFCHPGVSLGIITGWGGTQLLPRLIGEAKALEIFLTARRVDAYEALRIGLVDELAENPLNSALSFVESDKLG